MEIRLLPDRVLETCRTLESRIEERFPGSGLAEVAADLRRIAAEVPERAAAIRRPRAGLRLVVALVFAASVGVLAYAAVGLRFGIPDGWEAIQTAEAFISAVVFLGAATLFLLTLEKRSKRRDLLAAIEPLRLLVHIVDMHQLTKDPERARPRGPTTPSSPQVGLDAHALSRYLVYCSELLALIGKLAVLYGQGFDDAQVLDAVDDITDLTIALHRNIWQKLVILDRRAEPT